MENTKIKILCDHQTGYLPWLGLFHRISLSDIYVSLDTVKYNPRSYDSRNKIKTPNGFKWLNVPVLSQKSKLLKDIRINNAVGWKEDHLRAMSYSYGNSNYFSHYFGKIKGILDKKHELLMDLNEEFLKFFLKELDIKVHFAKASKFDIPGSGNQYLISLCKAFEANAYVFGQMGKEYADKGLWEKNNIRVYFHEYAHPIYRQRFNNFEPFLSVVDLLFNEGPNNASKIIKKGNITKEEMLHKLQ